MVVGNVLVETSSTSICFFFVFFFYTYMCNVFPSVPVLCKGNNGKTFSPSVPAEYWPHLALKFQMLRIPIRGRKESHSCNGSMQIHTRIWLQNMPPDKRPHTILICPWFHTQGVDVQVLPLSCLSPSPSKCGFGLRGGWLFNGSRIFWRACLRIPWMLRPYPIWSSLSACPRKCVHRCQLQLETRHSIY